MTPPEVTAEHLPAAYRDAVAIARAGYQRDNEGIAAIWNGTPNRAALIYTLARIPSVLALSVAAGTGHRIDLEAALGDLLQHMPHDLDDPEGDQPA